MPAAGWWQITKRAWAEAKQDQVPLLAGGVAFFSFLSFFPGISAAVLAWGLIASPAQMRDAVQSAAGSVPPSTRDLLVKQVDKLASAPSQALGIGLVLSILAALWSASGGVGYLVSAVNLAYDEENNRNFIVSKALALLLTLGAIVAGLVALGLIAAAPVAFSSWGLPTGIVILLQIARWVALLLLVTVALAVIYRVAPDRDAPKFRWVTVGSAVATVLWIVASVAFSVYVSNFGSYGKTYGSLAAVVVLMMWLWITFYIVLLGAEINAEAEAQTASDTTKGEERPMGERGAIKADEPPPREEPDSTKT